MQSDKKKKKAKKLFHNAHVFIMNRTFEKLTKKHVTL